MSVAQQAKAARRKAKIDPRYIKIARKDSSSRDKKQREMVQRQKDMQARKGAKK